MDKLANQLKSDAALIDVQISDELDRRISASLRAVTPEMTEKSRVQRRPAAFWWASSLTGVAAALIMIAVLNRPAPPETVAPSVAKTSPIVEFGAPAIDWKAESAMLTRPLQQELEDLRSDIKKAEQKVKDDIGL